MAWWTGYNSDRSWRAVQCPDCGQTGYSGKEYYQCNGKKRHRFNTDDNLLKTPEDRYTERQQQDEELRNELAELEKEESEIQKYYSARKSRIHRMCQQLKPLYPPKSEEVKPEPIQQAVTQ